MSSNEMPGPLPTLKDLLTESLPLAATCKAETVSSAPKYDGDERLSSKF
jgi:hypothetical protein